MGYPDLIAPLSVFESILEDPVKLSYREDSEKICRRHGMPPRKIPDAHSFFELMECELDVYDIVQERGCEIVCDLNNNLDPILKAYNYDIVLDVGTLEHCFNISQAIINMAGMVKVGGYIIHENPFLAGNHGFYSLNPTFFVDFYSANGFEVLECKLVNSKGEHALVPRTKRFRFMSEEANVFAFAKREGMQRFVYPIQTKYRKPVAGVRAELKEAA